MANSLIKSPLIVDTADAGAVSAKTISVIGVRWVNATTASHTAVIQDADSRVIWSCAATGAGFTHESNIPFTLSGGWKVPTLASGILYIYTDEHGES